MLIRSIEAPRWKVGIQCPCASVDTCIHTQKSIQTHPQSNHISTDIFLNGLLIAASASQPAIIALLIYLELEEFEL